MRKTLLFAIAGLMPMRAWARDAVWAPLFDQQSQFLEQVANSNNPGGNTDFPQGKTPADIQKTIATTVDIAYKKGIRVVDIVGYPLNYSDTGMDAEQILNDN